MSFRRRLLLFFLIIVVVPMVAVALALFAITTDSETGKADARIAAGLRTAFGVYAEGRERAARVIDRVATDPQVGEALTRRSDRALRARLGEIARSSAGIVSIAFYDERGREIASAGSRSAVAYAAAIPAIRGRGRIGTITVSTLEASVLAADAKRLTGLDVRVLRGTSLIGGTLPERTVAPPDARDVTSGSRTFRGRSDVLREPAGPPVTIGLYQPADEVSASIADSRLLIALFLIVFFLAALLGSQLVVRALQGRMEQLLEAARRFGRGDFSRSVPVEGGDEFAALGNEFNRMSGELAGKIAEVERQRDELERTIRLVGEAFAAGLDRQGTIDVAVRTAVEACGASAGRGLPADPRVMRPSFAGASDPELAAALEQAELEASALPNVEGAGTPTEQGERQRTAEAFVSGIHALAVPVRARLGADADPAGVGVLSIARPGQRFSESDREVFGYLAAQAGVSLENASLHEAVQLQAVTDELTGLNNARHFHQTLEAEIERSHRFRNDVGLVLLDIDDFKSVNDTFGHQQGDRVLMEVAALLETLSRDIDEVARYGGEEMAVVLPQADSAGAERLAERMRFAIEDTEVERLDGSGSIRITASFGVASLHDSGADKDGLIAAADAALYRAKRAGKNRVERAERMVAPR